MGRGPSFPKLERWKTASVRMVVRDCYVYTIAEVGEDHAATVASIVDRPEPGESAPIQFLGTAPDAEGARQLCQAHWRKMEALLDNAIAAALHKDEMSMPTTLDARVLVGFSLHEAQMILRSPKSGWSEVQLGLARQSLTKAVEVFDLADEAAAMTVRVHPHQTIIEPVDLLERDRAEGGNDGA
jgi:hypothetical protein